MLKYHHAAAPSFRRTDLQLTSLASSLDFWIGKMSWIKRKLLSKGCDETADSEFFEYSPIDSLHEIRLLTIVPQTSPGSLLHCILQTQNRDAKIGWESLS